MRRSNPAVEMTDDVQISEANAPTVCMRVHSVSISSGEPSMCKASQTRRRKEGRNSRAYNVTSATSSPQKGSRTCAAVVSVLFQFRLKFVKA